jgi:tetratricopeptide (TPR) repeat protein
MNVLCDDATMTTLIEAMRGAPNDQIEHVDRLLGEYPQDPRLHFLRGSMLAGAGRYIEAHQALKRAVELAPDYAIARFQLGFFQLTSGETANALDTWGRLDGLADGHYLRKFVDGLRCLIRDDFAGVIQNLSEGIALNSENPPLNNDMTLIIERCRPLAAQAPEQGEAASETALILQQFTQRQRPN